MSWVSIQAQSRIFIPTSRGALIRCVQNTIGLYSHKGNSGICTVRLPPHASYATPIFTKKLTVNVTRNIYQKAVAFKVPGLRTHTFQGSVSEHDVAVAYGQTAQTKVEATASKRGPLLLDMHDW